MVTDLLFEIEFDKFHFEEIHNNPPKLPKNVVKIIPA